MKVISSRLNTALVLIPLAFLFQGCVQEDLKAVEGLQPTAAKINQLGSDVISDFYASCIRERRLALEGEEFSFGLRGDQFIPVVASEYCHPYLVRTHSAQQVNELLVAYIESLIRLASNQTVNFSTNIEQAGASAATLSNMLGTPVSQDFITGGTGIANSLVNMWSANFRRESLTEVLICTNEPLKDYTSSLSEIVGRVYLGQTSSSRESSGLLAQERVAIVDYIKAKYEKIFDEFQESNDVNEYLSQTRALEAEMNSLMEALSQRQENALSYQQILTITANTHRELANTFKGEMTVAEVDSMCARYFANAQNITPSSNLAIVITGEQLVETREILARHTQEVDAIFEDDFTQN
jgi:hypothetical protein